jgi:catechol 2,3-dioxygenase-like lactoylglutathione lyase family enzyme
MTRNLVPMLNVPDVRATADWYVSIGFELRGTHSDDGYMSWALLSFGDTELMLNEGGQPSDAHRREVDLYLQVDDLEARWEDLKDRIEVFEEPHDTVYGMREFIIRDLNRFRITFGQDVGRS